MKLELKIEAPGVQVFAYEVNEETKALLEENAKNIFVESGIPEIDEAEEKRIKENEENGFVYRSPMEIVEENAKVTLISHGIAARQEGCKYTATINGDEKSFYPAMFEYDEMEDFENSDYIEDAINSSGWPDTVDQNNYVWIPVRDGETFKHIPGSEQPIPEGFVVIFEVISYSSGTLHTSFEVDEDFQLTDLKLIVDDPDNNDHDLAWLYYCDVFGGIFDQNRDKPFDEDTIRAVDYKGERHDFNLDFHGGSGWYEAHEKGEDDWFPSYQVSGWLSES